MFDIISRARGKKGSALMQVLVMGTVIAGIILLIMRFSMIRTTNVLRTKRKLVAKAYAEGCMAQFMRVSVNRELGGYPPLAATLPVWNGTPSAPAGDDWRTFPCVVGSVTKNMIVQNTSTADRWGHKKPVAQLVLFVNDTDTIF